MSNPHSPVTPYMQPGEQLLWSGRPKRLPFILHESIILFIFWVVLWIIFGIFALIPVLYPMPGNTDTSFNMAVIYVAFIATPLGIMLACILWRLLTLHTTWYAITNQRILLHQPFNKLQYTPQNDIIDVKLAKDTADAIVGRGSARLMFSTRKSFILEHNPNFGNYTNYKPPTFLHLPDAALALQAFEQNHTPAALSDKADLQSAGNTAPVETILWQGRPVKYAFLASPQMIAIFSVVTVIRVLLDIASRPSLGPDDLFIVCVYIGSLVIIGYLYQLAAYRLTNYTITNQRIIIHGGVINQTTIIFPYTQLQGIKIKSPFILRFLGLDIGSIYLDNGGEEKLENEELLQLSNILQDIPTLSAVTQLIQQQISAHHSTTVPVQPSPPILNSLPTPNS